MSCTASRSINFEQSRNAALDCAHASSLNYDYLLLADADMELVVEDKGFRDRLEGPGYQLLQRGARGSPTGIHVLVQRNAGVRYHGVTHEYLDVPGDVKQLRGVWYKDHASGSNRADKFERDINLLLEVSQARTKSNVRYWFYLAQSLSGCRPHRGGGADLRQAGGNGRLGRGGMVCPASGGRVVCSSWETKAGSCVRRSQHSTNGHNALNRCMTWRDLP